MKLIDFLSKIYDNATIWIGTDPDSSEGLYLGGAGNVSMSLAKKYEVIEFYPEYYNALGFSGISVIVKEI